MQTNAHIESLSKNLVVFTNQHGIRINLSYSANDPDDIKIANTYKFFYNYSLNLSFYNKSDAYPNDVFVIRDISLDKFNNVTIISNKTIDKDHEYTLIIDVPYSYLKSNFYDLKLDSMIKLSIESIL